MAPSASKSKTVSQPRKMTEMRQAQADSVQADVVRMDRSAAAEVTANDLDLRMSAASDVRASLVRAEASALATVEANEAWISNSAAGAIQAGNVAVNGGAAVIFADNVDMGNSVAGVVAAQQVRAQTMRTVLLVGGRIEGNVQTALDTRQTILAGLIAGVVAGALFLMFRRD